MTRQRHKKKTVWGETVLIQDVTRAVYLFASVCIISKSMSFVGVMICE